MRVYTEVCPKLSVPGLDEQFGECSSSYPTTGPGSLHQQVKQSIQWYAWQ